jgi:hypothetical protein
VAVDLFAGICVRRFAAAEPWYVALFGREPSFRPHQTEAVWQHGEHGWIYVVERPADAGHSVVTLLVDDLDALTAGIASRGIEAAAEEEYEGGVRKVVYRDPDGNEVGFGSAPAAGTSS